ncbi:hypothetical protein RIVM261_091200 [Rivularia sp. IAM M-261]|nr:hypothetical protein RIVM261_091200 [Rivularia sp. IAM M-261]
MNDYTIQQQQLIQHIKDNMQQAQTQMSIFEMKSDYENDDAISLTSVTLISKAITNIIVDKIIQPLQLIEPCHYYYATDLMHITIKNVRKMHKPPRFTEDDAQKVNNLFQKIIPRFSSFKFKFEGLVLFPTSFSLIGYCDETLRELVHALDEGLKEIGLADDKKYISDTVFFGNMTLCRFTEVPSLLLQNKIRELESIYIGEMNVSEINLVTCNVVCHPKSRRVIGTYTL